MLPLDHFERGSQIFQERHARIVKEKSRTMVRLSLRCTQLFDSVLSGNDQLVFHAEHVGH
jgi:hypothetical protein